MPIILLVRHGENDYVKKERLAGRLPNVRLNDHGKAQANTLAEELKNIPLKAVYSSPLERAMETAQPIAKGLKLKVIPRIGLIETDIGAWEGRKIKNLSRLKIWQQVQLYPSKFRFPKGESFLDAQNRIVVELDKLISKHEPHDIFVCVSHSDPIKLAVAHFIGLPLDMFQRLHIAPASITTLHVGDGPSLLLSLNYDSNFIPSK